jgi:hypothetical protein
MSSSCKEFDGLIATPENMERAKGCLRLALLYVDRTVNPPLLRYLEPDDSYEIVGWKREDRKVFYIVRLKDGTVVQLDEIELRNLDVLLKVKEKLSGARKK